jgi:hypothetical protein
MNPFAVLTAALLSVASPPESVAVPNVVLPIENVTLPVMVPAVVELTDATNSVVSPIVTEAGAAVSVVVVIASAAIGVLPVEAAKLAPPP